MSSKGGYAAQPPPRYGGDRFYSPPAVRRQQPILLQQQRQLMQMQLLQQQHQLHQRQMQRSSAAGKAESSSGADVAEVEKRREGDFSSRVVSLSIPPSIVTPASTSRVSNLDRLMDSVTPFIRAQYFSELNARGQENREVDTPSYFCLEDLWESFKEWSAYGAGVPLWLNGKDPIEQYYVPYLSGIQLYIDTSKPSSQLGGTSEEIDAESYRFACTVGIADSDADTNAQSVMNTEADIADSPRAPLFQFLEHEPPHTRRPLADKISVLTSQYPELNKYRSCDLLPTSWICVAWYPIYRIPIGPTLQDLEASFLTFHSLSTQSKSNFPAQFHAANTRKLHGAVDAIAKISLPVFALASYKLKGSMVNPCGPQECEQENSLLQAADDWLKEMQVILPDYQFFRNRSAYRR